MTALTYPGFYLDDQTGAAALKGQHIKTGSKGSGVALLQAMMHDMGFGAMMPKTFKTGKPDGGFGGESKTALKALQHKLGLSADGIAGPKTIGALDALYVGKLGPMALMPVQHKPKPKPKPQIKKPALPLGMELQNQKRWSGNTVFKKGKGPLHAKHDPGAGTFNSKKPTKAYIESKTKIESEFPAVKVLLPLAAKHFEHFFKGSGDEMDFDVAKLLSSGVPTARAVLREEMIDLVALVETLKPRTHALVSTAPGSFQFHPKTEMPYYYAVGGVSYWLEAEAVITETGGRRQTSLTVTLHICDQYNWDKGKTFELPSGKLLKTIGFAKGFSSDKDASVEDTFLAEFHLMGLAREYHLKGSATMNFKYADGDKLMFDKAWQIDPIPTTRGQPLFGNGGTPAQPEKKETEPEKANTD